jgi:putative sigma-54 modulation protein
MELQITGRNIDITPSLRRYIERKLRKLDRHLPNIIESKIEIFEEKTKSPQQHFGIQVTVDSNGILLRGKERGQDLFSAIDKVTEVMSRQIEHHKGKLYKKGRGGPPAKEELGEEAEPAPASRKVTKVKRFAIKPMSTSEAIDQMELLGHDFFLFLNAETEEINLLYRRRDNDYGLIEPELG